MNAAEVLARHERLGKPQTAVIYKRHGSGDNVFGTLTSEIAKPQKQIKVDDTLAMELWKTGNAEARILALLLTEPQRLTRTRAERLLRSGQTHFLGCYLAALPARSPIARETMRAWMAASGESTHEIGYGIMNSALISMRVFKPSCRDKAMEAAQRIGAVQVDHGETTCKTPDAVRSIQKASRHRRCP